MIGRIVIENYKSIENLSLDLGRVTVLIGANGSGKSNILEAVALCSAAAANKLDNEFLFSRGIRVSDDPRHMRPAFNQKQKKQIVVSGKDWLNESHFKFLLTHDFPNLSWQAQDLQWLDLYEQHYLEVLRERRKITYEERNSDEFIGRSMSKELAEGFLKTAQAFRNRYIDIGLTSFLLYSPENTPLRRFEEEGQIQPLGIRGEGLFKLLTVLARDENRDRLNDIQERLGLLDWFGDFQIGGNVAMGERTLKIRDQYLDGDLAYFTQRSANEGFLFLLFYFTLFVARETPRFFAIDNIDASLNPKLCAELLRQLTELAEKYDKQVILTTHNPAVLDGLNLRDENQKLYVVERDLEGRTQARRIEPRDPSGKDGERNVRLSEAFLRGYIGGLPGNF